MTVTRLLPAVRRLVPWVIGAVIVVVIATRVPFDAFRTAMTHGPHVQLALMNIAILTVVLGTDSFSTWVGLLGLRMRRSLPAVIAVRGATFLLFIVNYAVGQGGFGYYLHATGESVLRATGATLFLIGTNLATLLLLTSLAWIAVPHGGANGAFGPTLAIGCAGFALYLGVIAARPAALARRDVLAPLFEAGLGGHALAMVGRLPHVLAITLGHWAAMRVWGIAVPFSVGLTIMPAVVIASVIPISPAGLGTTQAAFVFFFSSYAPGATAEARTANILAFAIVHFVYGVLASLAVGLACMPFARRYSRRPASASASAPA